MKTMTVAEFKSQFSEVIQAVKSGEEIAVSFGRKHETIGIFIPFSKYYSQKPRKLGILNGKSSFKMKKDFKITEEEFLDS
ncbi:putative toxin-antitoxin system, antitoxin component, PHD family [Leptospira weilii serovar Ranarum str. ICFT]|uniref:Toxin-antitoxin system, antitoxin component, PHD family n=1 Tax=Leptospira weilii serovar Ranarum str. ICFT TaxID=1218598 RepID=N1WC29_9LEPT|nr:putative toxin-antitoxin system, antitoxin component, PHD family [Leptospira weilii serovar Ranarum str. ICFT]